MRQTEKYKFKLIETSDPFSPDAINDHAQALEDELLRYETGVDQRIAAHEGAVSSALAQHHSDTDAALARQTETVVQCREQNCLFKLGGPTTLAAPGGDITFSLTGVDMSQYAALLLVHTVNRAERYTELYLNNKQVASLFSTGGYSFGAVACTAVIYQPVRNCIGALTFYLDGLNDSARPSVGGGALENTSWTGASSLRLTNADFAVLYGLKK